tara:strand:+ start:731 stop:862 length:132 start_codon:yes stop_codon:yes gene_type:complete
MTIRVSQHATVHKTMILHRTDISGATVLARCGVHGIDAFAVIA